MLSINVSQVEGLKKQAKKIVSRHKCMRQDTREALEGLGFQDCDLGTGSSSYTHSCDVSVMDIKSLKYLKGRYLVVGESSRAYGKYGVMYQGYAIQVK